MNYFVPWMLAAVILAFLSASCLANEPISPIPEKLEYNAEQAEFGKSLFFDKRLSADNTLSCASCHNLQSGFGAESSKVSTGIKNQLGTRNSPTVFNSALNFTQFWDGRASTLQHQASEPVVNPVEMGMTTWEQAINNIKSDPNYVKLAKSLYNSELNEHVVTHALAEFEKTLLTPNSPFDRYLKGDQSAISEQQKKGYSLFKAYGCVSCHQGTNVGGNMFQKFGVLNDIAMQRGTLAKDLGRYNITGNEWDKRVFKVPSLRLAVKTPPYFHDGSVATIEEAVEIMIKFQLGREVPKNDRQAIIAFLNSLVGELPKGIE